MTLHHERGMSDGADLAYASLGQLATDESRTPAIGTRE